MRPNHGVIDADWNSTAPETLLDVIRQLNADKSKLGRRKLRLYACACCRCWWNDLSTDSREALEITERYADGRATRSEFGRAQRISTYDFGDPPDPVTMEEVVKRYSVNGATNWLTRGAKMAGFCTGRHLRVVAEKHSPHKLKQESKRQITLLREVFGNPNDPPKCDPAWLEWNDGTIPKLADEMNTAPQSGDYARLRRYLNSAGCDDSTFLDHCGSRHSHVLGCWLLDVLRGVHWPKQKRQPINSTTTG